MTDTPDRPKDSTANTAEVTYTDKYTIEPEEVEFDEATLTMLLELPRTFRDIPYAEDDDL